MRKLPSDPTTVNLQMFSSEIVSHYGITQLPPMPAEGEAHEGTLSLDSDEVMYTNRNEHLARHFVHCLLCLHDCDMRLIMRCDFKP